MAPIGILDWDVDNDLEAAMAVLTGSNERGFVADEREKIVEASATDAVADDPLGLDLDIDIESPGLEASEVTLLGVLADAGTDTTLDCLAAPGLVLGVGLKA